VRYNSFTAAGAVQQADQVHSRDKEEVEESRCPPLPAVKRRGLSAGDEQPSLALSILVSLSSATSVDPDIW